MVLTGLLLGSACSTDLDLVANWKEITIVYGLLNPADKNQYIKINKAFLDEERSALEVAQIADSLYHSGLTVTLEEIEYTNDPSDGVSRWVHTLIRVDANEEFDTVKTSGSFANKPNYVYKSTLPILQNTGSKQYLYKLRVETDLGHIITAETPVVSELILTYPRKGIVVNWGREAPVNFRWREVENGKIYQLSIRIHMSEWPNTDTINKSPFFLDWPIVTDKLAENTQGVGDASQQVATDAFYHFLAARVDAKPGYTRNLDSMDLLFVVGAQDLQTYLEVNQAQTGITSTQIKPDWTNVDNGLGIFSSRFDTAITGVLFHLDTNDTLACGPITGVSGANLGFRASFFNGPGCN